MKFKDNYGNQYELMTSSLVLVRGQNKDKMIIPREIDGYEVTVIGDKAFFHANKLVEIELPDTICVLGNHAFNYCVSLEKINIPNGIQSLPFCCFFNCEKLSNITLPQSVESIGNDCFQSCKSLKSITMPNVTSINNCAFMYCNELENVYVSKDLKNPIAHFILCKKQPKINKI